MMGTFHSIVNRNSYFPWPIFTETEINSAVLILLSQLTSRQAYGKDDVNSTIIK